MALIPPSEYKQRKGQSTESARSSSGLISPSEYKQMRQAIAPEPEPAPSVPLPPLDVRNSSVMQSVEQTPTPPATPAPAPTSSLPGRDVPVIGTVLRGLDKLRIPAIGEYAMPDAPMIGAGGKNIPGTNAREAFLERTGASPATGVQKLVGQVVAPFAVPGAGLGAGVELYRGAEQALAPLAPRLGQSLGGRVAQGAIKEAAVGVPIGAGIELSQGSGDVQQAALQGALGGAIGGAVGAAGPLVGAGAKAALQKYRELPSTQARQAGRELLQQINSTELPIDLSRRTVAPGTAEALRPSPNTQAALDTFRNREAFDKQYAQAVDDQLGYLQQSMRERGGVDPGGLIRDEAGEVTGRFGRVSNNPPWYQEFFRQFGRAPTQAELRQLAEEQVRQGFPSEVGPAPAWRPEALQEIDDELRNIDTMMQTATPEERTALTQVRETLTAERQQMVKALPDGVQTGAPPAANIPEQPQTLEWARGLKRVANEKELNSPLGSNQDISIMASALPESVGRQFDAHGIAQGTGPDLDNLINLLDNGVNPNRTFYSARLSDKGELSPFTGGSFVAMSGPGQTLKGSGIKNVIVNDAYYEAIPELRQRYPNVNFIRADEAMNELPKLTTGTQPKQPAARSTNPDAPQMLTKTLPDGRPLLPEGGFGDTPEKPTKISDIVSYLAKELDIPVRVGRYRYNAHGIFKPKSGVVRTRLANDLPTISHEIGHRLDRDFELTKGGNFDAELMKIGRQTSGPGYSTDQIRKEGVAEFFRRMLTDPQDAIKEAPGFYSHVMQKLPLEVKKILTTAQEQIKSYVDQPLLSKIESKMSIGQQDKRPLPGWDDFYKAFVDEYRPIRDALKEVGSDGEKLMRNFSLLRGVTGRAQAFLKQGVVDSNFNRAGKSFQEILEPVKSELKGFRQYLIAKRAVELGEVRGIRAASDISLDQWRAAVQQLETPEFITAQKELLNYQDAILDELVRSGVITPESIRSMREANKNYVPFFRVYEAEAGAGASRGGTTSTGKSIANQRNPINKIKGSTRDIVDPLESIIKNTYQYIAIAERNKAMRDLVTVAGAKGGLGGLVEAVPTPMQVKAQFTLDDIRRTLEHAGVDVENPSIDMDAMIKIFQPSQQIPGKDNIVAVYQDGTRKLYQLDPDLYRAVMAADSDQMGTIVRALNFPVRILRSGIVNTLEFWLRNMWRDQFSAMINTQNGYIPWVDMIRGMGHVLRKDDVFTQFLAAGGGQGLRQSLDRRYLQDDLRNILAVSMKDKAMNVIKNPLEAMRALSELSELGTRLGEFRKGVKKDGSAEGIRRAALSARDLIDFSRAGTVGKNINKVSAFWNASVQGLDKTIRAFKQNPKKNFGKALAFISAPTAGLYALNRDDPRYQELQQWDKDLFWHFWVGDTHFRLPIPFELGVVFKVLPERLLSMTEGKDQPFRKLGETVMSTLPEVPNPLDPIKAVGFLTALTPLAEVMANKNFAKAPIVPKREESLLPADQYGPYTSELTKLIARGAEKVGADETFAGSPRQFEHILTGYTGSLGKYALQGIDRLADLTGLVDRPPRPATGVEGWPGFKAFVGKSLPDNTDSIDRFYERLDVLTKEQKSATKRQQPYEGAGEAQVYNRINRSMGELRGVYRLTLEDKDLSPIEKRRQLDQLNAQMNELAKAALDVTNQLKAAR